MAFQAVGRFFYNYELSDGVIRIVVLGVIPVKSIQLTEIENMREVSLKETLRVDFTTLRLGNRMIGRILEITKKKGLFKRILITPDEPERFLEAWLATKKN